MGLTYLFYVTIIFILITFILFEKTTNKIETLTLVAVLSSLSSVGRILFAAIPSVQPSSFIIMCSGLIISPIPALMVGVMTAFSSSLILGFGIYSFYQAFLWGLLGLLTSLFKNLLINKNNEFNLIIFVIISFIYGIIFGFIMNFSYFSFMEIPFNLKVYFGLCLTSLPFDIAHGLSTSVLFIFTGKRFINMLYRINKKYAL